MMERDTFLKVILPAVVLLIAITSVLIITGLASENPDGFEWSLFEWAGVEEPSGTFEGLFTFLGSGPVSDAIAGGIGIIIVLLLAYIFFRYSSRKPE